MKRPSVHDSSLFKDRVAMINGLVELKQKIEEEEAKWDSASDHGRPTEEITKTLEELNEKLRKAKGVMSLSEFAFNSALSAHQFWLVTCKSDAFPESAPKTFAHEGSLVPLLKDKIILNQVSITASEYVDALCKNY